MQSSLRRSWHAGRTARTAPSTRRKLTKREAGAHLHWQSVTMTGARTSTQAACNRRSAFDLERRNGAAANVDVTDHDTDDDEDTPTIVTANGVYVYNCDWNGIEKSRRPTHAAAGLLHRARQRTDTSRWWSMRWPSDAVSLLGRACDLHTGNTYELMRQLREHSASHLRLLWRLTTDRRQCRGGSGARQLTQAEWSETKRRLGPTGRNSKR